VATIRKHGRKWQSIIRKKKIVVRKSFWKKSDARLWSDKTEAQIEVGSFLEVQRADKLNEIKVYELLDIFFDKFRRKTKHKDRLKYEIEHLKRYPFSKLFLSQLTPRILSQFRDEQEELGKSGSTVNKYIGLVSRAINLGRREYELPITYNPCSLVERCSETRHIMRTCSEEEWSNLLNLATKVYPKGNRTSAQRPLYFMRQIIEFARETLMRQNEIFNLRKSHINFAKRTALVEETKNETPRVIGLSPKAIKILQSLPTTLDGRYFPVKSRHEFNNYWFKLRDEAKVDIAFHTLRHMGATDLIKQGWSIAEVKAQGGWKTLKALQRYLDIQGEHLATRLTFKKEA
jgi:integrase|tara:strand:- start:647 stop:1684 length:1038 start_codon:yes stop_codon:yes gene_type:complete